jgi:hypothetical protein
MRKSRIIIIICIITLALSSCKKDILPIEYIVTDKFTITIKTKENIIELVPIIKVYSSSNGNDLIVIGEQDYTNIEIGYTVFVKNKNVVRIIK